MRRVGSQVTDTQSKPVVREVGYFQDKRNSSAIRGMECGENPVIAEDSFGRARMETP